MSRKKLAWANKEVETFVCILGEVDVVYDVYVAAAAIDIRPTTKGTVGSGNATSERSWTISPPPYRTFAIRSVPHPAVEKRHNGSTNNPPEARVVLVETGATMRTSLAPECPGAAGRD
ncbi:unnamed protein product [Boreogadus saida]